MAWGGGSGLVVDVREFDPSYRRAMLFSIVDKLVEMGCNERLLFVCDHEPAGIGYQIDLRRETRGKFEFEYEQRSDGSWVACIQPKVVRQAPAAR